MVNADGERFIDEGADFRNYTYAKYGAEVLRQPQGIAAQIFDARTVQMLRTIDYEAPGATRVDADTLGELAAGLGIDAGRLERTVAEYNAAIADGDFDPTIKDGKRTEGIEPPKSNWALPVEEPPFTAFPITCGITFTFGGVRVDQGRPRARRRRTAAARPVRRGRARRRPVLPQLPGRDRPDRRGRLRAPRRLLGRRLSADGRWRARDRRGHAQGSELGGARSALCLIWALTFIAQRTALRESDPMWIAAGRTAIGACAAPFLRVMDAFSWRAAAAIGLTSVAGFVGFQLVGLDAIGAGPAAAIVYTQPVLVAIGAHLWLGERVTRTRAAGALIGLAGVTVVSAHELSAASPVAVAALFASAVSWTAGTLLTRATPGLPVLPLVAAQHLLAAPLLIGVAAVSEPFPELSSKLVAMILYAGVFGAAGGQLLYTMLLRRGEASVVSAWMFSVPIAAAVLAVVLLASP